MAVLVDHAGVLVSAALSRLAHLMRLDLAANMLVGPISPLLAGLPFLTHLSQPVGEAVVRPTSEEGEVVARHGAR